MIPGKPVRQCGLGDVRVTDVFTKQKIGVSILI